MIQALRDAPTFAVLRPPVELFVGARSGKRLGGPIGGVDVVKDLLKVGGRRGHAGFSRHRWRLRSYWDNDV